MKARGAGFESANSLTHNYQPGNSPGTSGGATVITAASSVSTPSATNPLDKTQWLEYSDSLEDSLAEAKEYAATLVTKAEEKEAALMAKFEMAMEQNTKLIALMAKGGFNANNNSSAANEDKQRGPRRGRKEQRKCKHCGEMGYHEDEQCFSLDKNKDKRPKWYKDWREYDWPGSTHLDINVKNIFDSNRKMIQKIKKYIYTNQNETPLPSQAEVLEKEQLHNIRTNADIEPPIKKVKFNLPPPCQQEQHGMARTTLHHPSKYPQTKMGKCQVPQAQKRQPANRARYTQDGT